MYIYKYSLIISSLFNLISYIYKKLFEDIVQILDPDLNQKLEGEEGQGLSDLAGTNEAVEGGESSIHKDSESQYRRSRRDM